MWPKGLLAAQRLLEIDIRHELDGLMYDAGFELVAADERGPASDAPRALYHSDTEGSLSRHPGLRSGWVGLSPCVDVTIEDGGRRLRVDTEWGTAYRTAVADRGPALVATRAWLAESSVGVGPRPAT